MIPGELPRVVNEAEDALLLLGQEFYQRGGMLVRPVTGTIVNKRRKTEGWQLIQVTRILLVETLCCAAQFVRSTAGARPRPGSRSTPQKRSLRRAFSPRQVEAADLSGIVQAPFLRSDGSLCETPGYDPESKLLFQARKTPFPPIPQQPCRDEALQALALLEDLIGTFPFVTSADRSVALAAMLTALDRRSMATAPLFAFNSPAAGTGKSKLVDLCAILATGRPMSVISQGRDGRGIR